MPFLRKVKLEFGGDDLQVATVIWQKKCGIPLLKHALIGPSRYNRCIQKIQKSK